MEINRIGIAMNGAASDLVGSPALHQQGANTNQGINRNIMVVENKFYYYSVIILLFACGTMKFDNTKITIIISREKPNIQKNFRVIDLYTNVHFIEVVEDSIYQLRKSELRDSSLLMVDGAFSCIRDLDYHKSKNNDTLFVKAVFCRPVP